ncbi:hypothetical protein NPIL_194841 [Nephila pilipes]|uniref:Uncharacterized protein n=1 Tax=Nephila pilipes TaxID=299642 RepID=A0A8X6PPT4_NEPPI|nr:hypothetical protein NPIL_194841 [Nephila pilipes]
MSISNGIPNEFWRVNSRGFPVGVVAPLRKDHLAGGSGDKHESRQLPPKTDLHVPVKRTGEGRGDEPICTCRNILLGTAKELVAIIFVIFSFLTYLLKHLIFEHFAGVLRSPFSHSFKEKIWETWEVSNM